VKNQIPRRYTPRVQSELTTAICLMLQRSSTQLHWKSWLDQLDIMRRVRRSYLGDRKDANGSPKIDHSSERNREWHIVVPISS
jgi:hypothetical protein